MAIIHHPAIISHDSFNAVQTQKKLRINTIKNPDGTITRKPSKYSGKKVLNETFDKKQLLADLGINDD